ncbi:MAG: thioesterase family protein [Pseudomonadota bacterium]
MTDESRVAPLPRSAFVHFQTLQTRWSDNDIYRHVNNAVYYHLVDTVVNGYLVEEGALDIERSDVVGLVVETRCNYFAPLVYPQNIDGGLAVQRIGRSSIIYQVGLFAEGATETAALAKFVHVYVDRDSHRPTAIPAPMLAAVKKLTV